MPFGTFTLPTNPSDPAVLSRVGNSASGGRIDASGRGQLSSSERTLLEMQAKNRATAGMSPAAVEARQAAPATDMAAKSPRNFRDSIGTPWRRP
jgi:hypothetical protein